MGRYVLWASASYGPVRLMGRCVLWTGTSYGPGNTVSLYFADEDLKIAKSGVARRKFLI